MSSVPFRLVRTGVPHLVAACVVSVGPVLLWIYGQTATNAAAPPYFAVAQSATYATVPLAGNTIIVNSTADVANNADGLCTLREAITAANTDTASGAVAGECGPGSGSDSDTINLTGVAGTITLSSALPNISSDIIFSGPGPSQLIVSGNNLFRVFNVTLASPGVVNFSGITIANGKAPSNESGGGIFNQNSANINVSACTVRNSSATQGGGIANGSGAITLSNSTVNNNNATRGGGIYNLSGAFNLISSTVNNNGTVNGPIPHGGGINTGGTLNVINSTISNNSASGSGGGIYVNAADAVVNITNGTIVNNNASDTGGGVLKVSGSVAQVRNSLIALNSAIFSQDVRGSFTSLGHNLISNNDTSTGFTPGTNNPNGDLVGIPSAPLDPVIGPLQNNGGSTQTRAVLPSSPAIDAGDNCVVLPSGSGGCLATPLTIDQRAVARQAGTAVDIGAFESRGFTFSLTSGTPQSAPVFQSFAPLVVTVNSAAGDPVAGGLVTFSAPTSGPSARFSNFNPTVNARINDSGQAGPGPVANGLAGGPYVVTAVINGLSGSALFTLTNLQGVTNTVLSSSANPSDLTQSVTFTATVNPVGSPTGTVQFNIDGSPSGSPVNLNSSGITTLTTSALAVGTHTVTADYSGDANFLAGSGTLAGGQVVRTPPSLSMGDVSLSEGDSGPQVMSFPVTLSPASNLTVNVNFATANGTATAPSDYVATNSTLSFSPGQTSKTISVTINGDVSFEPNETLTVTLSNPSNATINEALGVGTIQNDDAEGGFIRFSQATYTIGESTGELVVTVNRSNDTSRAATIDYATNDTGAPSSCGVFNGLASSRCDFTTTSGTLRFAVNETVKTFTVLVNRDSYVEGLDQFTLLLSNLTGGAGLVTPSSATVRITDSPTAPPANLIDDSTVFVRQHYHDFLNREPDAGGLQFWVDQIESCGSDAACRELKRINVSAAFFLSIEFQETGYLAYRMYNVAYGETTSANVSGTVPIVRLHEFRPDSQEVGFGVQVGIGNWQQQLEDNKNAYALEFVQRPRFVTAYPLNLTADEFVTRLDQTAGGVLSVDEKSQLVAMLGATPGDAQKRSSVVRRVAEDGDLRQRELNRAFVLMQFYGYLRRNPDDPQDTDFRGWKFWLDKLNQFNGNFVDAEMVKAFLVSGEYRQRFGTQ
jgi:CSLREA domain-containing protein